MKKVTCMLLLSWLTLTVAAQSVFSNQTNAALKKVIEDYPNHFSNVKGDRISAHDLSVNYASKVVIPGSVNCMFTEFNNKKEAFNWKCELFASPDFEKASKQFNDLFNQIHNTIIKLEGEKPVILNGQFEMPEKSKKETRIFFHFLPATGPITKLKVELLLQQVNAAWTITLQVYEMEPVNKVAG